MDPLSSSIRYEAPSYIEEYRSELTDISYYAYKRQLEMGITLGRYFLIKHYHNPRKKSQILLPPSAYCGRINLSEKDLVWKMRFGPYLITDETQFSLALEDIRRKLSDSSLAMREGSLDALIMPMFSQIREKYSFLTKYPGWPQTMYENYS